MSLLTSIIPYSIAGDRLQTAAQTKRGRGLYPRPLGLTAVLNTATKKPQAS
jgi:hypothetical protein